MSEYKVIYDTDTSSDSAGTGAAPLAEWLYSFLWYQHACGIVYMSHFKTVIISRCYQNYCCQLL